MKFPRNLIPLLCLLFSACSLPVHTGGSFPMSQGDPHVLMRIHIESWGTPRFTGLLGLQFHDTGLTYMLLDATGITLLESLVPRDGDFTLIRAAGTLGESSLPGFLASSLRKIFLIDPATEPCADTLILRFCKEKTEANHIKKYVATGPFTFWKAEFNSSTPEKTLPAISFSEPWLGVSLSLTNLNRDQ
jgi:hypothetical protein